MAGTKTPQFRGPDGVLRDSYIFTTDIASQFFNGTMDVDTVDMQVSVRGSAFTSDPDAIIFEGTTFTVPNPAAYPDGLQLFPGENQIEVRAVLSNGTVTASAVISAQLSLERDVKALVISPSGISVERFDHTVKVTVDSLTDPNVIGYNFYASTAPGGGTEGYGRINPQMVISGETVETTNPIGELVVDANIATNPDGSPVADPTFVRVTGEQTDKTGKVIQTDYNQSLQLSDTVKHIKTTVLVEDVVRQDRYSFTHDRRSNQNSSVNPAIPNAAFNAIPETDPLYYVATAVYLIDNQQYESAFSPEVAASPLIVTPAIANLPVVSRQQIVRDTSLSIYRSHPEVDIKPGSITRDTVIDPFSTEAERLRFIINFLQAAQSFATLLPIDDPGFTGTSIPVSQSPYKIALKQAFFLQSDSDVQNMIDNCFDQLAAQRGTTRLPGQRARGEVNCYMTERPTTTRSIVIGQEFSGGGVSFRATSSAQLSTAGFGTTFNPITGRYSVRVFIQADQPGEAGNLAPGQINVIISGPPNVKVVNDGRTFGGHDVETNRDLAARATGILSAVDSGTRRGYTQNSIDVPGVRQSYTVEAGNPLMLRDINPDTGKHKGGKVDLWLRGESLATVTDSFAFSFQIVKDGQFEPIGPLGDMKFRAVNDSISLDNPLIEMLDVPDWGYEFKDLSTGKVFDLTDVQIILPDGIQLSPDYNDPVNIHLGDVFKGSYRFRTSNEHVFARQPVRDILSFSGDPSRSGTLSPAIYKLFPGSPPLIYGKSTEAGDYVQVIQPITLPSGLQVTVPSSQPIVVTDEEHVILFATETLNYLGINPVTVHVYNVGRTVEYYGPYVPNVSPDFTIIDEVGETPLTLKFTTGSRIHEGDTVLVDYQYDENFVVEYETNSLVGVVQDSLDEMRHITADILSKEMPEVGVDISGTVVLHDNQVPSTVDSLIRTALGRKFGALVSGEPVRQSDVIAVIESVTGVSYCVVPLTKMVKTDGSMIIQERVYTDQDADFFKVDTSVGSWCTNLVDVFLLKNPLESGTLNSGGQINDSVSVTINETQMIRYLDPPNMAGIPLRDAPNGMFIIGNDGLNIPGYSDDVTLKAAYPFASDAEIATHRKEITACRILVALASGTTPLDQVFDATYVVYGDSGVKNIEPGRIEYLVLGNLNFVYDVDTTNVPLMTGRAS